MAAPLSALDEVVRVSRQAVRRSAAAPPQPLRFVTFLAPNLRAVYQFLARQVEEQLDYPTEFRSAASYADIHEADVAFLCGLPYVELANQADCPVEPLVAPVLRGDRYGGKPIYFSDVIVRRASPLRAFGDLRGCSWACNEPRSQSGYGITRQRLLEVDGTNGFFGKVVETGWHERSLRQVVAGEVDASAIDSHVLAVALRDEPELAEAIHVIDSLGPSSIQPVVVRRGLPRSLIDELRAVFLALADDFEACRVLQRAFIERFVAVDDSTYDDIRVMLRAAEAARFLELR